MQRLECLRRWIVSPSPRPCWVGSWYIHISRAWAFFPLLILKQGNAKAFKSGKQPVGSSRLFLYIIPVWSFGGNHIQSSRKMAGNKMKKILWVLFAISVILYWIFNSLISYWGDDYAYTSLFPEEGKMPTHERITTIEDVVLSQWHHYFTMNGRALVHVLIQCFCGLWGKWGCDILAAFLFSSLLISLGKTSFPKKNVLIAGFVSTLGFVLCFENISCCYTGISYVMNYLWSASICMLFYVLLFRQRTFSIIRIVGLSILGFLAGWSNESFAIPLCAGLFFFLLFSKEDGARIWRIKKYLIPIVFCMIGGAFLVFAPANFDRANGASGGAFLHDNSLRLGLFAHGRILFLFVSILIVSGIWFHSIFRTFCKKNSYELIALVCTAVFFLAVGVINHRATMGIELLSWILLCRLLSALLPEKNNIFILSGLISALLIIVFEAILISGQMQIRQDHEKMAEELDVKKSCKDVIIINDQKSAILSTYLPVLTDECNLTFMRWFYCSSANICDGLPDIKPSNNRKEVLFSKKGDFWRR